jgi:hypothetical protein
LHRNQSFILQIKTGKNIFPGTAFLKEPAGKIAVEPEIYIFRKFRTNLEKERTFRSVIRNPD